MHEAARGVYLEVDKGTHCSSHLLPGRSWLGARVRHIGREELFREIKLFRFHSGGGRDRVSNRKRQMTANAPRISLLCIRNLREQDSWRGGKTVYMMQSTEEQNGWEYRRGTGWHARET